MEELSAEVYAELKAQIISELKAEKREKARLNSEKRRALNKTAEKVFEPTRQKYYTRVLAYLQNLRRMGLRFDTEEQLKCEFERVERMTCRRMYLWSNKDIVKENRAAEANKIAEEILETMLRSQEKE